LDLAEAEIKAILERALAQGGDFADIYFEENFRTSIFNEEDRVEKITSGREVGVGIRVVDKGDTYYAYSNDLEPASLFDLAAEVALCVAKDEKNFALPPFATKRKGETICRIKPDKVALAEKVKIVERCNAAARAVDERIIQVTISYRDSIKKIIIINSEGEWTEEEVVRTQLMVNVTAREGKEIQTGYESMGGTTGFEIFEKELPEDLGRLAAQRAVNLLLARNAPAGTMPVVMAGEAGGTMIHEACGHGLEADLVQKGISVYQGKKGEAVASPVVTIIDDATLEGKHGSYPFDDEGVPAQKTVLIENGVLKSYLYDRITALKDNVSSTGNGRRESYQHKPIPRMSNTYLAPGEKNPAEIIAGVGKGLLVKKMGGGQVNTTNGDFVFEVAEGYILHKGEVKKMVRGAVLSGNGPQVLQMIEEVGNDLNFDIGTCGKDGQGVPVSDGQPTILIKELVVGGRMEEKDE